MESQQLKKYAKWTGKKLKDLEGANLLVETVTAPLGVKRQTRRFNSNTSSNVCK